MTQQAEQVIRIPVQDIIEIDGMPYRVIDEGHVNALVSANEPDTWPPIKVTLIGTQFGLIGGQHRLEAAKRLKLATLQGIVATYAYSPDKIMEVIYMDMWEDNARNARAYTVTERKEHAVMLSVLYPNMSYREIGRRAGIDEKTARTAIKKAEKEDADTEQDTEQRNYNTAMASPAKRLVSALNAFLNNERNLISAKYSTRNEERRAHALAKMVKETPDGVELFKSLARTFDKAASITEQKRKGGRG